MARVSTIGEEYVVLVLTRREAEAIEFAASKGRPSMRRQVSIDPTDRAAYSRALKALRLGVGRLAVARIDRRSRG